MFKITRLACLFFSFFLITTTFADSRIISTNSFKQVTKLIEANKDPHHLLLALDDDDTLTMIPCYPDSVGTKPNTPCEYLGGPAWFSWQASLHKNNPDRIWKNFHELLSITNFLLTASKMPLDDPAIPTALHAAANRGAHILVVSARGYSMLNATEEQFQQDGILKIIEHNAIKTSSGHISFPAYYFPHPWNKHLHPHRIAYTHGVLYVAGQDKGVLIKQFLAKTNETKNIRSIIYVDDTLSLVKQVARAYKNDPHVNVIAIHFIRLAHHKSDLTHGKNAKQFQMEATKQWHNIQAALHHNLLGSNF